MSLRIDSNRHNEISLIIPELRQINVFWEEVRNGLGTDVAHSRIVYVAYQNQDDGSIVGKILEDNDGLGYNFGVWLFISEGATEIGVDAVMELLSDSLETHEQKMQAILTLLNTSEDVQEKRKKCYEEDMAGCFDYEDGQPDEAQEWEPIENEPYESMYGESMYDEM
jgi:hypothetical protein